MKNQLKFYLYLAGSITTGIFFCYSVMGVLMAAWISSTPQGNTMEASRQAMIWTLLILVSLATFIILIRKLIKYKK